MTETALAEGFCRHEFTQTYAAMRDDIEWLLVGDRVIATKAAVIAECEKSSQYLASVKTSFERFRVIDGGQTVVVDSLAAYVEADGSETKVASCDIFDFADGAIAAITSFTVEVT